MHLSGCDGVTTAQMMVTMGLCVQVELSAKGGSVGALRDTVDPTATGPCALRIVESQKEEEFVI